MKAKERGLSLDESQEEILLEYRWHYKVNLVCLIVYMFTALSSLFNLWLMFQGPGK